MAALPTGVIKLSEVIQHFIDKGVGTFTKLSECAGAFNSNSADSTYYPGGTVNKLSYFKGYDHIVVTLTQFNMDPTTGASSPVDSCNITYGGSTYWHNGGGTLPVVDDYIYTNSNGSSVFNGSDSYFQYIHALDDSRTLKISSAGKVLDVGPKCHKKS